MKNINMERFTAVKNYLIDSDKYTIERFLRSNNLMNHLQYKSNGGIILECPFHEDKNPSLSVDLKNDIFRCFSCNTHGRYINFVHEYYLSRNSRVTIYDIAERILKADTIMQKSLGFKTIYRNVVISAEDFDIEDLNIRRELHLHDGSPVSYRLIADALQDADIEKKVSFVKQMQAGESAEDIWKVIIDG